MWVASWGKGMRANVIFPKGKMPLGEAAKR